MNDPQFELKLFVVGESSGDPADWGDWTERIFVIAKDPDSALRMCHSCALPVSEIVMKPGIIARRQVRGLV